MTTIRRAAAIAAIVASLGAARAGAAGPPEGKADVVWEMATYYVALIFKGPAWTAEATPEVKRLQEGHMANIRRLGESGKLLLAGPFTDDGDLRGLFVFKVGSIEEARALCDTDPAIQAGRLRVEIHPWFGAKNIVVTPTAALTPPAR